MSLDEDTYEFAKQIAAKQGVSMSRLCRNAIRSLVGSDQGMTADDFFALAEGLPKDRDLLAWDREKVHERGKGLR